MRHGSVLLTVVAFVAATSSFAANPLLGEVEIDAASRLERDAGVWLDGQYVGFVKDLSGKGRLVLVPGEHQLLFKLVGYEDVAANVVVEPGSEQEYRLAMQAAAGVTFPTDEETAELRISVEPDDAAIFVDGAYVGHVDRFNGRKGMRLAAGTYQFTIALPGYQAFETELTLRTGQKYEIKTDLPVGSLSDQAGALIANVPR